MANSGGFAKVFNRGRIEIYSGSQPVTADAAITGTLLGVVSASSAALTKETRAASTITVTGGSTSILTVTVGGFNIIPDGAVLYNTSTTQTASDLSDAINRNGIFEASVSGAVVTIRPPAGSGTTYNAAAVTSTGSVTATYVNMSGGVAPVNGLIFGPAAVGVITKLSSQVWSFQGVNGPNTAGWFRLYGSDTADSGAVISTTLYPRLDGSIATSGADLNLSNITITNGSTNTIDTFAFTIPAA